MWVGERENVYFIYLFEIIIFPYENIKLVTCRFMCSCSLLHMVL